MTDLAHILERLGLLQYLDNFTEEGFDTWEVVVYATESDLETLGLKLGHRRKLQKEIAEARGISIEHVIGAIQRTTSTDDLAYGDVEIRSISSQGDNRNGATTSAGPSKRKYRRHPKPDEHAPERAPSAYVIFSNKTREELRPQKLSFTDIAKTVGERWQVLDAEEKEQYEAEAASAKDNYIVALAKYKRTNQYRDYQKYLLEFKARNTPASTPAGSKRPKLETEVSSTSTSSGASVTAVYQDSSYRPRRKDSLISQPTYSPPISFAASPPALLGIGTHSRDGSVPSSISSTPVNATFPIGSLPYSGPSPLQQQKPHLPRILPIEARETRATFISNLLVEPSADLHPRRTNTGSPTAFLRQETSKSSSSSALSGNSVPSAYSTPITPVEESRSSRALPPLPALLHHASSASSGSLDMERRSMSNIPPSWTDVGELTPKQAFPQSFHHLSLSNQLEPGRYSLQSSLRDTQHLPPTHLSGSSQVNSTSPNNPNQRSQQPGSDQGRMDPLSALVLAGRLVDQATVQQPSDESSKQS